MFLQYVFIEIKNVPVSIDVHDRFTGIISVTIITIIIIN